ncbi:MAG: hypothetical protein M1838_000876 [Thelocarpon superellum]|nr:MAG: hypothetical protein M1838_000876 [Thelocarpon superellum]
MRNLCIFSGSSHPALAKSICEHLGTSPAAVQLDKFSNGETSVRIGCSIRDKDVFVVQSGSSTINDDIMELCIMISACKGGSANKITAVMPYFPYSRQSKQKSARGAITARMIANLLSIAGVHHIITVDLHASQMQGFFGKPVDNLLAEPLIARWIRHHVPDWQEAVVVSKNPGGTKRVTSLADTLKLNFGIVTTDRRRNMAGSVTGDVGGDEGPDDDRATSQSSHSHENEKFLVNGNGLAHDQPVSDDSSHAVDQKAPEPSQATEEEEYNDGRARDVITGRLVHGHLVDDDYPSPSISGSMSASFATLPGDRLPRSYFDETVADPMTSSVISASSIQVGSSENILSPIADVDSEEEEVEGSLKLVLEKTITLVGNVKEKTVFIVDDMIDKPKTWIAAAETVVKRGGAKKVYCIATHGLFGYDCLQEMERCDCIDYIVVTNSFPIPAEKTRHVRKLVVLDLSNLLAEAIRRNHYGESISRIFQMYND